MEKNKLLVKEFWNNASCGEELYLQGDDEKQAFINQSNKRYELEPFIIDFAEFSEAKGKRVLEIGVGLGADHQKFAESGAEMFGIDLTERAIMNTKNRLNLFGLNTTLTVGDAEKLNFKDNNFDIVYTWGVIHHSPNTEKAIQEILRVLKKGGKAKIMIYHKYSIVGYMLWLRYALLKLKPFTTLAEIYSQYLESPGTKAYTIKEAYKMLSNFSSVEISTVLTHGDLLTSQAGQRHNGFVLNISRKLFPVWVTKKILSTHGLFMLINATK